MKLNRPLSNLYLIFLLFDLFITNVDAGNNKVNETKTKLLALNNKIVLLQQKLQFASNKNTLLVNELGETEKKINEDIKQLREVEKHIKETETSILRLQQKINHLNQQLNIQQTLLAKHIRARYEMGNATPFKWIFNQEKAIKTQQLFIFYRYFIRSRQQMIENITITKKDLFDNQKELNEALVKNRHLQAKLKLHQQKLYEEKIYNNAILASLNKEISNKKVILRSYQRNKTNLAKLLQILNQESLNQKQYSFTLMRKKYPKPVAESTLTKKMNQGLIFFAKEGAPVVTIHPGKVVFSDWLNGYGLLLIVDHGQGFMSLYAHNQSLWKQKGDIVEKGEQIATVGHSGGIKQNGLYFEIRQRGKALSPLRWLS